MQTAFATIENDKGERVAKLDGLNVINVTENMTDEVPSNRPPFRRVRIYGGFGQTETLVEVQELRKRCPPATYEEWVTISELRVKR